MANENGFTGAGTFIEVSSVAPTAQTAIAYAAVTGYTEVGGVDDIGEIGATTQTNSRIPLKSGVEVVVAGSTSYDAFAINGALVRGDEGQELLEAQRRARALVTFCINYADGGKEYGQGIVTKSSRAPGDANSFTGAMFEIKPSGETVIVDPV
jgi:hypothetical protein